MKTNFSKLESSLAIKKLSDSDLDTVVGGDGFFDGLKKAYSYVCQMEDGYFTKVDVNSRRAKVGFGVGLAAYFGFSILIIYGLFYGLYELGNWMVRKSEEKPDLNNKKKSKSN